MGLAGVVSMAGAATLAVVAFLHLPVLHVQIKPLKPSEHLPGFSDVRAYSPEPPLPAGQQVAKMESIFGSMCRTSVRSEAEQRKLDFPRDRVSALCGCLVQNAIETRFTFDGKKGFENFGLIVGKDTAPERRAMDDVRYRAMLAGAERACAAR